MDTLHLSSTSTPHLKLIASLPLKMDGWKMLRLSFLSLFKRPQKNNERYIKMYCSFQGPRGTVRASLSHLSHLNIDDQAHGSCFVLQVTGADGNAAGADGSIHGTHRSHG